jgi:hypothetical protein
MAGIRFKHEPAAAATARPDPARRQQPPAGPAGRPPPLHKKNWKL